MFYKQKYNAIVKFPDGKREVIPVQASSEWDARYALPDYVKERNGEFLYAVEEKYGGLIEKLNQIREKRTEKRRLVHSLFVDRITPENGEVYATIPSGGVYEVYRHPEDQNKIIVDGKYVADKDHFYRMSCSVN
jgi:hypothetical protein